MTTLAVGSSASIVLADGGTVSVATNGGFGCVVATPTGASARTTTFGPAPTRQVFGPYAEGAVVVVSNTSCNSLDYDATNVSTQLSLNNFSPSSPLYIAHRGAALMYPENTLEAFRCAVVQGAKALELDVHALSDLSTMAVMHDATVDRTTTSTGNVVSFNAAGWRALAIDANTVEGSNYGNALEPPLLTNVLREFKGKAIFLLEAKSAWSGTGIATALQAEGIARDQALAISFTMSELAPSIAAGYDGMFITQNATPAAEIAQALAAGVRYVGLEKSLSDAVFQQWMAAGLKVFAWTVNRRADRDRLLALGVHGLVSNDPQYLSSSAPLSTSDQFLAKRWQPGMIASSELTGPTRRGSFSGADEWGLTLNGTNYDSVLLGHMSPVGGNPNNPAMQVDFEIRFDAVNAGDQTRWFGCALTKNDKAFTNTTPLVVGDQCLHFLPRKNGVMEVFANLTTGQVLLGSATGAAIADGEKVAFRIVTTPTTINFHRLNGSGGIVNTVSISDSNQAYRGGYVHFGRNGLTFTARSVSAS